MKRSFSGDSVVAFLWHLFVALAAGFVLFQWERWFNYPTTHEPAIVLFGDTQIIKTFAQIIVSVDVLFLGHSMLRAFVWKSEGESFIDSYLNDKVAVSMASAWALTTLFDLFFTWFYLQGQMQVTGITARVPADVLSVMKAFPVFLALLSWVAQAALIVSLAKSLQQLVEIVRGTSGRSYGNQNGFRPTPVQHINKQPVNNPNQPHHKPVPVQHIPHNNKPIPRENQQQNLNIKKDTYHPVGMADPLDFVE